jgi:hypothetical protein
VLGALRKQGRLLLVLILPDQSRAQVPAAWTDLENANTALQPQSPSIGSIDDLLRARSVVDAFVNRSPSKTQAEDSNLDKVRRRADESRLPHSSAPDTQIGEKLDDKQKQLVTSVITRIILKAAMHDMHNDTNTAAQRNDSQPESNHHE